MGSITSTLPGTYYLSPLCFLQLLLLLIMSPSLPEFLLNLPRNPVVAVGLPLTLGFLSGSRTKKAINGIWYQVGLSILNASRSPSSTLNEIACIEPFNPSRETPTIRIPNHLDHVVRSDGLRFLPGRPSPRQHRPICYQVWLHRLYLCFMP